MVNYWENRAELKLKYQQWSHEEGQPSTLEFEPGNPYIVATYLLLLVGNSFHYVLTQKL